MSTYKSFLILSIIGSFLWSCNNQQKASGSESENMNSELSISKDVFGETPMGTADLYTLNNKNGITITITNFGGIIVDILTPDKNGDFADINLGFNNISDYVQRNPGFGALIGRYGNRIGGASFSLDGKVYELVKNNGPNHLHGGTVGFDDVLWNATEIENDQEVGVELKYLSKDMEEGYPGNLDCTVRYTLNNMDELKIEYFAATDKKTVVNLTNHSYFNLAGESSGDILSHVVELNCTNYTPVDNTLIPTGEIVPVAGTPLDFTSPTPIGDRIDDTTNLQMKYGEGYDHNFVIDRSGPGLVTAATVYEPNSGRSLEVLTTEPGVQFYTGNFLTGELPNKTGGKYPRRGGFCLETQHYPDSPNQPDFPSVVVEPGETYQTTTIFRFGVR